LDLDENLVLVQVEEDEILQHHGLVMIDLNGEGDRNVVEGLYGDDEFNLHDYLFR